MGVRLAIIASVTASLYGLLLFHLYGLQIREGSRYGAAATSQANAAGGDSIARGSIFGTDKNGNRVPLALNKKYQAIYAVPGAIEDAQELAQHVSVITGIRVDELLDHFSRKSSYELLVKKATPEQIEKIQELNAKGIGVQDIAGRYYPFGSVGAQVLGFVGLDDKTDQQEGKYGLEEYHNAALAGANADSAGNEKTVGEKNTATPGTDINTTLDPTVEIEAQRILARVVEEYKADSGTAIVLEPSTGKILAMESVPSFDPNDYGKASLKNFINSAVQEIYEPGSVFKVLTMAAGIDSGKLTPDTTFNDSGSLTLNGRTIRNWDHQSHGTVTMTNVIELSLNTGAAYAQRLTGNETFKKYLEALGLTSKTGVDLPGERAGDFRRLFSRDAPGIAFATASFGQGVALTPLSILNAVSVLANDGVLMRPYVNDEKHPEVVRRVLKSQTAAAITKMMVSAVDKAKVAHISGYSVAGKTGTAFIPDFKKGGYSDDVINTYIGFAPASHPRFAILFKIVRPQGAPLAGTTVVPAFRQLAQFLINYYNIPPDRIEQSNQLEGQ